MSAVWHTTIRLFAVPLLCLGATTTFLLGVWPTPRDLRGQETAIRRVDAGPSSPEPVNPGPPAVQIDRQQRERAADLLVQHTLEQLANGPAFDAKLTQEIRVQGRSAVGVGRYEQAGGGTGRISMEMMIPTANGRCLLQQICDGRLSWTREQVGQSVRLRRVDVARLDELLAGKPTKLNARLRVGGIVELLERCHLDYALEQVPAELEGQAVWMLRGPRRDAAQSGSTETTKKNSLPNSSPKAVAIAIAAANAPNGFGKGLPVRFEFWSNEDTNERRLISYLKIYDAQKIQAAPEANFRFETSEADINYTNDTQRYLQFFGAQISQGQSRATVR